MSARLEMRCWRRYSTSLDHESFILRIEIPWTYAVCARPLTKKSIVVLGNCRWMSNGYEAGLPTSNGGRYSGLRRYHVMASHSNGRPTVLTDTGFLHMRRPFPTGKAARKHVLPQTKHARIATTTPHSELENKLTCFSMRFGPGRYDVSYVHRVIESPFIQSKL
jgi:hypothetical protein